MAGLGQHQSAGNYLTIVQGSLRQQVPEGTEGSKRREHKKDDGSVLIKNELVFFNIEGYLTDLKFEDSEFGKQLKVYMDLGKHGKYIVCMGMDSRFASDFLQKLPNVDFTKEVKIHPYSIENGDKKKTGVSLTQGEVKIQNYFYDFEAKENINGFPIQTEEKPSKDDWKVFFIQVKKFLERYTTEKIIPMVHDVEQRRSTKQSGKAKASKESESLEPADSTDEDLPF